MTGLDDPYEPPLAAEIVLDTVSGSLDENVERVLAFLQERGMLGQRAGAASGDAAGPPG